MTRFLPTSTWPPQFSHLEMQKSYAETARDVTRKLRRYSALSVLDLAFHFLNKNTEDTLQNLNNWPWITCLIIKLTLEDNLIYLHGDPCPEKVYRQCMQALWDAQSSPDLGQRLADNVFLSLRAVIHAQMAFQHRKQYGFLRTAALINRLKADHPIRFSFEKRFGLCPFHFMVCSLVFYALIDSEQFDLAEATIQLKQGRVDVDAFLQEFCRDIPTLRRTLVERKRKIIGSGQKLRLSDEYTEQPWLEHYPLVWRAEKKIVAWHPMIFYRGIEQAVHRCLSENPQEYANDFSLIFEDYVIELLESIGTEYISETEFKDLFGADKNAMEAIFIEGEVNIFIEAKFTSHNELVNHSSSPNFIWMKVKHLRKAMEKAWQVLNLLSNNKKLPEKFFKNNKENYLLIVTNQQLSCPTGLSFKKFFGDDIFEIDRVKKTSARAFNGNSLPNSTDLERLPLDHIVIVSIDEYEQLIEGIRLGLIDLPAFLRQIASEINDPRTSFMQITQVLERKLGRFHTAPLIASARDEVLKFIPSIFSSVEQS